MALIGTFSTARKTVEATVHHKGQIKYLTISVRVPERVNYTTMRNSVQDKLHMDGVEGRLIEWRDL